MPDIFTYVPGELCDEIIECGYKLSEWGNREIIFENEKRRCFSALLNPKDHPCMYRSEDYKCLRFEPPSGYCFIAEKKLYEMYIDLTSDIEEGKNKEGINKEGTNIGDNSEPGGNFGIPAEILKLYYQSIIPLENYIYGMYRKPECLVFTTIIPDQISRFDKRIDIPLLIDNSLEFYINNLFELRKEGDNLFIDKLLFHYFSHEANKGLYSIYTDNKSDVTVFADKTGKVIILGNYDKK